MGSNLAHLVTPVNLKLTNRRLSQTLLQIISENTHRTFFKYQ